MIHHGLSGGVVVGVAGVGTDGGALAGRGGLVLEDLQLF